MTHTSTEQPEALPCPFCGSRARRAKEGDWHGTGCAGAHGCPAYLSALTYRTQEEADEAWNHRTPASQAQRVPLTRKQINECSRDAQIAFCMDKHPTYEVALTREVERILGITQEKQG